jgi:hypothetical protein
MRTTAAATGARAAMRWSVTFGQPEICQALRIAPRRHSWSEMRDDGEVHLEDMIAMEQVAQKLWQQATNGTDQGLQALSVLAKQAWRNRARMEVASGGSASTPQATR